MKLLVYYSPFSIIEEGITSFLLLIDSKIYGTFSKLYSLYLQLARAEIFQIDTFDNVIKNLYTIAGVIALFVIAFSLLQAMANSEDVSKGTKTTKDIIVRLILCVGLTCITPFVFNFLYDVQNSILSYGSLTKLFLGDNVATDTTEVDFNYKSNDGTTISETAKASTDEINKNKLQIYGNQMAFYVLSGFLYPNDLDNDGTPDDVIVDASKYFDTETGINAAAITCGVAVVGTVVLALTGVLAPVSVGTGTVAAAACIAGGAIAVNVNGVLVELTKTKFSWNIISTSFIQVLGEFEYISAFSSAIKDGRMNYIPIVSTVAGIVMLYMLFSFCLDLGIRAAKLVFYQIMAPISFLLSIIPKNKDLMTNWFKAVLTTWGEVFIRIICVLGAALLISNLNFTSLSSFGLMARSIIVLGIVAFVKQMPKLFSEITGIKTGDMKLGIRDKLAAGGAFVAGGIVGGALTAGVRNAAQGIRNKDSVGKILRSSAAGMASGAVRSGKSGWNAKSFGDMKKAASKGATDAVNARDKRSNYKAAHGGTAVGAMIGHMKDFGGSVKNFVLYESIEGLTRESQSMGKVVSKYNTFNDTIENLLEKEQAKGNGSLFLGNGFALTNYAAFDAAAQNLATAKAHFNNGAISAAQLRAVEGAYIQARDNVRDELMNMSLEGTKGKAYQALTAKGQAALKDSLVNAESLQATILENASSKVVQDIMGANGNNSLKDIMDGNTLTVNSFTYGGAKLKDAAKVAQGKAEIKIAEMNKEQAAKGDKK